MNIQQFRYAADNLGYVVYGDRSAAAIDGGAVEDIQSFIRSKKLTLKFVTNTHSHPDHTTGNRPLLNSTEAEFLDFNSLMRTGEFEIDGQPVRIFHTPGHTRDSVCFYFRNILISGDTLFNGKVGRCFTGDYEAFFKSIKTLLELPEDTVVYAGHDYVEEYMAFARQLDPDNSEIDVYLNRYDPDHVCATLAEEKKVDPFLRFNEDAIVSMLKRKGLSTGSEYDRWESLMSLM